MGGAIAIAIRRISRGDHRPAIHRARARPPARSLCLPGHDRSVAGAAAEDARGAQAERLAPSRRAAAGGKETTFSLPWSGGITSVSNRYHETIPGDTRRWIEPKPRIELGSADYFANRDPVLDALLASFRDPPREH